MPAGDPEELLAALHSLIDTSLAHLDIDEMLNELLARVCTILDCDTAAVLILDSQTDELVARAACGIEEEVRQGVRIPLGTGFAGRIAATRSPVRLERVDETTVANPILWGKGIKVMLGVPLLSSESVLGVLHVGRMEQRPFGDGDVRLLQIASDRIASAIQTRQLALERAASSVLERSLLPGRLPVCPGLRFATRFVAAEHRVGGDWYDLFTLPSGTLWVVVGDVAGHGLSAAVVMGRIRSALRAYTMLDLPPEDVLTLVDRKVNHFEIGTIATVACAVVEPPYEAMTISLAGHPPPVMVAADRAPEFVDVDPSPPIGTNVDVRRRSATVALEPDSLVAFYTDGLVERRGESLDAGMERLLRAMSVGPAERVAADVMRDMIGTTVPIDDIALVVMRRGY